MIAAASVDHEHVRRVSEPGYGFGEQLTFAQCEQTWYVRCVEVAAQDRRIEHGRVLEDDRCHPGGLV
jgi:hypothetical protein